MKRVCALLLCVAMLLASAIFAEAAVTGTPYNNAVDFESATVGTITEATAKSILGSIFYSWEGKLDGNTCEIIEDGYKGQALKLTSTGSGNKLMMKSVYFPETAGENAYLTFKFKIANNAGSDARYDFKNVGDSLFSIAKANYEPYESRIFPANGTSILCKEGKWYSVALKYTCGEVGSPNRFDIVIADDEGHVATGYRETNNGGTKSNKMLYVQDMSGIEGQSIVFDEFRMTYGQEEVAPALVESNLGVIEAPYTAKVIGEADFNDYTGKLGGYLNGKPEMFKNNAMFDYAGGYVTTTPVEDCNGGLAPEITVFRGKGPFINTVDTDFSTGKTFVSLKIRMPENTKTYGGIGLGSAEAGTDGSNELFIRGGNFEFWNYWGRGEKIPYIPNIWYTIVVEFEVKDGIKQAHCHIYDDLGKLVVSRAAVPAASFQRPAMLATGEVTGMISIANQSQNTTDDLVSYAIDDIKILKVTSDTAINTGNIIAKEILKKVPQGGIAETTTPAVKVKFDQIISDASTAKFVPAAKEDNSGTPEEDEEVAVYNAEVLGKADFNDYQGNLGGYLKGIQIFSDNAMYDYNGGYVSTTPVDDGNDGLAPQITVFRGKGPYINTVTNDFSTGKLFASLKIKMPENTMNYGSICLGKASAGTDGSSELFIRGGNFEFWNYWGRGDKIAYTPNMWYTIVVEFEVKGGKKVANCYIYDEENNLVVSRAGGQGAFMRPGVLVDGDVSGMISIFNASQNTTDDLVTYVLDDIQFVKVTSESSIDAATVIEREIFGKVPQEEPKEEPEDEPLEEVVEAKEVSANILFTGSDNIIIVPAEPLKDNAKYNLVLSDVKGIGGVVCDTATLSFSTIPYVLGTMTYEAPVYNGTTATVEVDFTNALITKVNAKIIGALYDGDLLVWSSVETLTDAPKEDCVITFTNLPEEAANMTFKLFAWDNAATIRPLFASAE